MYGRPEFDQQPSALRPPPIITLLRPFKINYLLKEEVFSGDRAQTCTDVKPFQKLSGFHLFHIVNHLHLRKKMTKIINSMTYHLESSNEEVYEYYLIPVAFRISLKRGRKACGAECGKR